MKNLRKPPKTKTVKVVDVIHGIKIADPYRWLEKDNQEVQEWLERQNAYARLFLDKIPEREIIKKRFNKLFKMDSIEIPVSRGNRYFFGERKANEDLSVLYVQEGLHGSPRVLIDPNKFSKDKTITLCAWCPSRDGKLLAYTLSEAGNDQSAIYVLDVDKGKNLPDFIPAEVCPYLAGWASDNSGFWYTHRDFDAPKGEEKFHRKLYFHKLGRDFINDPMIFGKDIAKEDIPDVTISKDDRYVLITVSVCSGGKYRSDIYIQDTHSTKKEFLPVVEGMDDVLISGTIYRDKLYIITNHRAPFWKIMAVGIKDATKKGLDEWKTIIPQGKYPIEGFELIGDNLFVETLENVHSVLKIYQLDGKPVSEIELPTLGSINAMAGSRKKKELFFEFSSFFFPYTIYRFDIETGKCSVFKKMDAGINTDLFKVDQVWYPTKDGTKIPMFLVYKKGLKLNGKNPVMLYGYGGFNINITPSFQKNIVPFLENGGVYVLANIRGGGEFGEEWHKAGMFEKKQNVFDDFIAAAEYLIKKRYTNPKRLAIFGWSNGGLLVGAVLTQRPDLFKAAVIGAPVIDMIRYHKFHGGRHWIPEYGSAENPKQLKYLLAYCPYQNVKDEEKYPAVLTVTADKDDRVHPMHAFKMTARLQAANASDDPILLRVEMKAGHSGANPIYKLIEQYADLWAFVFWQLGIKK